eukprot:5427995-Alexandrium_andersonii.AAC.1
MFEVPKPRGSLGHWSIISPIPPSAPPAPPGSPLSASRSIRPCAPAFHGAPPIPREGAGKVGGEARAWQLLS